MFLGETTHLDHGSEKQQASTRPGSVGDRSFEDGLPGAGNGARAFFFGGSSLRRLLPARNRQLGCNLLTSVT